MFAQRPGARKLQMVKLTWNADVILRNTDTGQFTQLFQMDYFYAAYKWALTHFHADDPGASERSRVSPLPHLCWVSERAEVYGLWLVFGTLHLAVWVFRALGQRVLPTCYHRRELQSLHTHTLLGVTTVYSTPAPTVSAANIVTAYFLTFIAKWLILSYLFSSCDLAVCVGGITFNKH